MAAEIVSLDAYRDAVNAGRKTFPGVHRDDADPVVEKWTDHVTEYAVQVPGRIAQRLADVGNALADDATIQETVDAYNAALDGLEYSVTRYANPLHGAGQEGYAAQLGERDILMNWVLDSSNPCDDCAAWAAGGPYTYDELPAEPGDGTSQCADNCRCSIIAEPDSWAAAMDEAA